MELAIDFGLGLLGFVALMLLILVAILRAAKHHNHVSDDLLTNRLRSFDENWIGDIDMQWPTKSADGAHTPRRTIWKGPR